MGSYSYSSSYLSSPKRVVAGAGAGASGSYATQHQHQRQHQGRGAELRGYAEYLSSGSHGHHHHHQQQQPHRAGGGDDDELRSGLLRPGRYSTYQERRPFY
jgi:hypothetical protein